MFNSSEFAKKIRINKALNSKISKITYVKSNHETVSNSFKCIFCKRVIIIYPRSMFYAFAVNNVLKKYEIKKIHLTLKETV